MQPDNVASTDQKHRVGPFDVIRSPDSLVLRFDDQGSISFRGCLLLVFAMLFLLVLGIMAIAEFATSPAPPQHVYAGMDNPARILAPQQNYFGLLWVICTVSTLILVPLYIRRAYTAAQTWTFRRSDDAFLKGDQLITRMRRIEHLSLRETRDPDDRFLYILDLYHSDGRHIELHCDYDERQIMNLANEISVFVGTRVVWP